MQPEAISSSYTYNACAALGVDGCQLYRPVPMIPLEVSPPFTYSYQCGSTLLVSYIPVYLYSVVFQIGFNLSKLFLMMNFRSGLFPTWCQMYLPAIGWPDGIVAPATISLPSDVATFYLNLMNVKFYSRGLQFHSLPI